MWSKDRKNPKDPKNKTHEATMNTRRMRRRKKRQRKKKKQKKAEEERRTFGFKSFLRTLGTPRRLGTQKTKTTFKYFFLFFLEVKLHYRSRIQPHNQARERERKVLGTKIAARLPQNQRSLSLSLSSFVSRLLWASAHLATLTLETTLTLLPPLGSHFWERKGKGIENVFRDKFASMGRKSREEGRKEEAKRREVRGGEDMWGDERRWREREKTRQTGEKGWSVEWKWRKIWRK